MVDLFLLRHAKSDWHSPAVDDFQRPLNARGLGDAPRMGRWMAEQGYHPSLIASSSALRAWQTAVFVCFELGISEQSIKFSGRLYLPALDQLLDWLRGVTASTPTVMLVGHNPGLEQLLSHWVSALPVPDDGKLLPTATFAHIELPQWDAKPAQGRLRRMVRPKDLPV